MSPACSSRVLTPANGRSSVVTSRLHVAAGLPVVLVVSECGVGVDLGSGWAGRRVAALPRPPPGRQVVRSDDVRKQRESHARPGAGPHAPAESADTTREATRDRSRSSPATRRHLLRGHRVQVSCRQEKPSEPLVCHRAPLPPTPVTRVPGEGRQRRTWRPRLGTTRVGLCGGRHAGSPVAAGRRRPRPVARGKIAATGAPEWQTCWSGACRRAS